MVGMEHRRRPVSDAHYDVHYGIRQAFPRRTRWRSRLARSHARARILILASTVIGVGVMDVDQKGQPLSGFAAFQAALCASSALVHAGRQEAYSPSGNPREST